MRRLRILFHRLRSLSRRNSVEADLEREMDIHLEQLVRELMSGGMSEADARLEARRQFGALEQTKEQCRDTRRVNFIEDFFRDLSFSMRSYRKSPAFALTAIVSLTLGVGVNAVVFSILNSLLLRPLSVVEPDRIQFMNNRGRPATSFPAYREIRDRNTVFESMFAYRIAHMAIGNGSNGAARVFGYLVTGNYFESLGIRAALGRLITPADDQHVNASLYVVLSHACWRNRFAGDPAIVGRDIRVNGRPYRVLGVAPAAFHGTEVFYWPEVWIPMTMQPEIEGNSWLECRQCGNAMVAGRLRRGVSVETAQANLQTIAAQLQREHRAYEGISLTLSPPGIVGSTGRAPTRAFLGGIMLLALLVLAAACSNLAALHVARGLDRGRELGIRLSIGATRGRIVRQLITESVVLSLIGGVAGLGISVALLQMLSEWHAPLDFPVQFDVTADWRVFVFAFAAACITGVLSGCGLARRAWKTDPAVTMKGTPQNVSGRRWGAQDLLLPVQIALCCLLVTASVVALRGMLAGLESPLGYRPDGVAAASYDLGFAGYDKARGHAFHEQALRLLAQIPGVESAAYSSSVPLSIDQSNTTVYSEGTVDLRDKNAFHPAIYNVSPGYFHTVGTRMLAGREFTPQDDANSPQIAIVNERFVRKVIGTKDAVGRHFLSNSGALTKVVGVVEDGKYETLTEAPKLAVFYPILKNYSSNVVLLARSQRTAPELARDMRRMIRDLDPNLAIFGVGSLRQMLGLVYLPMRAATIMLSVFGLLAIMLALTGIYGLSTYTVARRSREIGVRVAIGARPAQVLRFVFGRLGKLVTAGSLLGLAAGLAGASVLRSIVYQASARDPIVIALAAGCMLLVSLAAGLGPARRCLRIDPMQSLRQD